jgi:hypothetical protein
MDAPGSVGGNLMERNERTDEKTLPNLPTLQRHLLLPRYGDRKRESLKTKDEAEADQLLHARNEALRQAPINIQIAKAYLSAADPKMNQRTWQDACNEIIAMKSGSTKERWGHASREAALAPLLSRKIVETRGEHFLAVLRMERTCRKAYFVAHTPSTGATDCGETGGTFPAVFFFFIPRGSGRTSLPPDDLSPVVHVA